MTLPGFYLLADIRLCRRRAPLVRSASGTHLGRGERRGRNEAANCTRLQGRNYGLAHGTLDARGIVGGFRDRSRQDVVSLSGRRRMRERGCSKTVFSHAVAEIHSEPAGPTSRRCWSPRWAEGCALNKKNRTARADTEGTRNRRVRRDGSDCAVMRPKPVVS